MLEEEEWSHQNKLSFNFTLSIFYNIL
jgi:hypothetical protein